MTDATVPVLFVLWFRAKGGRWTKIGRFGTRAEALTHCRGTGDFHIAPLCNEDLAGDGPSLFDAAEVPAGGLR